MPAPKKEEKSTRLIGISLLRLNDWFIKSTPHLSFWVKFSVAVIKLLWYELTLFVKYCKYIINKSFKLINS